MAKIFVILGDAAIAAEPRESSLDDPATWQDDKAFQVVTALDDFEAQHRNFGNGGFDLPCVVAIVRPDQFEPGKAVADFIEDKPCAIAVLDAGGMNDGPQRQAFGVDKGVNLSPLDLLTGVIAYLAIKTAPFSAAFSVWLSMTAAVGLASRPSCSRKAVCSSSQIASHTPSFWNLRKIL